LRTPETRSCAGKETAPVLERPKIRRRPDPILDGPVTLEHVRLRLLDWRRDHRALSPASREHVRRYIEAIIAHDPWIRSLTAEEQQVYGLRLWQAFRRHYDSLNHTEREDVILAMDSI
jgi:hypothetical protein